MQPPLDSTRQLYKDRSIYSHTQTARSSGMKTKIGSIGASSFVSVCASVHICVCEEGGARATSSAQCEVMGELKWRGGKVRPLGRLRVS